MSKPQEQSAAAQAQVTEQNQPALLDQIIERGRYGRTRERGTDQIKAFIAEVVDKVSVSEDTQAMIDQRIKAIDEILSKQLNEILHHPDFKKLEGTWRGLHYLLAQSETGTMLKIKVLNVAKDELKKSFRRSRGFDQSDLFLKVYEEEFGQFGGQPFAALLGDYEFGRGAEDVGLLEQIAGVAAAAHAPFISAASPEMLNLDDYTQLHEPTDIAKIFDSVEYAKWKSFRDSDDARYVSLTLPHILMRLPYGKDNPVEGIDYTEDVSGDHGKYLWGNAAYALAARMTQAFNKYGWCAAIRGVEGGGTVEGLPVHLFETDDGVAMKCPTETPITDRREKELDDAGFVPLVHCKGTDYAAFFAVQSCHKPKKYDKEAANANARLSAQLQYIMATSRFAHYLKAIMRDKIGSFASREQVQRFLNDWIVQYATPDDNATQETKAQKPLRDVDVQVSEVAGKPGVYQAVALLRPHFQLEGLTASLRLVAELPNSKR
jgi:type VI secretion system protein ImpC